MRIPSAVSRIVGSLFGLRSTEAFEAPSKGHSGQWALGPPVACVALTVGCQGEGLPDTLFQKAHLGREYWGPMGNTRTGP